MYVLILSIRFADPARAGPALQMLEDASHRLPMIHSHVLQPPLQARPGDPQILWRICFESEDDYRAMQLDPAWVTTVAPLIAAGEVVEVESIFYRRTVFSAPWPDIRGGIWRALIVAVKDGIEPDRRVQFETEMKMMPAYVGVIRNWALNPVLFSRGSRNWSYVWEQDFDDIDGLMGEYRMHPIHFGLVDRWYDPEHPDHILDARRLRMVTNSPVSAIAPPGGSSR